MFFDVLCSLQHIFRLFCFSQVVQKQIIILQGAKENVGDVFETQCICLYRTKMSIRLKYNTVLN